MDTSKTVDVSPAEWDRVQRRVAIRQQLKTEFNRQNYNPYRYVYRVELLDPAIQRFMAARASRYEYWKPTWKGFWGFMGLQIFPILFYSMYLTWEQRTKEMKYRSGEISYRDRKGKHVFVPDHVLVP